MNRASVPSTPDLCSTLPHRGLATPMALWVVVNIGSGNDLQSDDTKPLPEPMFINYSPKNTFLWNLNQNLKRLNPWKCIWKCFLFLIKINKNLTRGNAFENVICKTVANMMRPQCFNSLRPSDAIWRHRSGSTLAQVIACCLTTTSHYLNQCWLIISKVLWHSSEGNFTRDTSATIH